VRSGIDLAIHFLMADRFGVTTHWIAEAHKIANTGVIYYEELAGRCEKSGHHKLILCMCMCMCVSLTSDSSYTFYLFLSRENWNHK